MLNLLYKEEGFSLYKRSHSGLGVAQVLCDGKVNRRLITLRCQHDG